MLIGLFGTFSILLFLGIPVIFAVGLATYAALSTQDHIPLMVVTQQFFTSLDSFSLIAIPLFMLAGEMMSHTGLTAKMIRFAVTVIGHIRGGFAQVTVLTSVMFSGISGSASADASAVGSMLIPALKKEKYDPAFAVSLTATTAILGSIIPPSIMMIIYGSMTGVSIGKLFIAGIIPGVVLAGGIMVYCYYYARKHNIVSSNVRSGIKEIWSAFKGAFLALVLPIIVIGGIRTGYFTPTEAGAIAVLYVFVLGQLQRTLKFKDIPKLLVDSAVLSTVALMIMGAAAAFGWILTNELFPQLAVELITSISNHHLVVYLLIIIVLLLVGIFLEPAPAIIILAPVLVAIQQMFGYDPIHFAVIVIITLTIGGVTPPVGGLLFITMSIGKVTMSQVFWKVWPFVAVIMILTVIMMVFPSIVTFLPNILD